MYAYRDPVHDCLDLLGGEGVRDHALVERVAGRAAQKPRRQTVAHAGAGIPARNAKGKVTILKARKAD